MGDSRGPVDEGPTLELPSLFRRRTREAAPEQVRTHVVDSPGGADRPASGPSALGATGPKRARPIEPRTAEASEPARPGVPAGERIRAAVPDMAEGTLAAVVGAIVGLAGCIFTWLGLQGCEVVTGAQTCGGPGLLVLGAIVVGQILLGVALLKMLRVPEPGNLSFLGVGITVVVALLLLVDYLYEAWTFAAIPVVTALSFAVARWIITKYVDDTDDYPVEQHDIR